MSQEIDDAMEANALGPAEVEGKAGRVSQHSLPDLIEYDRYRAGKAAGATRRRGVRFTQLIPPGTTELTSE